MCYLFCVVLCIVCVYMCTELLPPGGYQIAVKYISYHIISYHILSYHIISYHIIILHMALRSFTRERVSLKNVTTFETIPFLLSLACISGGYTIILKCIYFGLFIFISKSKVSDLIVLLSH